MRLPLKRRKELYEVHGKKSKSLAQTRKTSLCHLIQLRSIGKSFAFQRQAYEILRTRIPAGDSSLFKRCRDFDLGSLDKVFTARWLDSDMIVAGTKCNRLLLIRLETFAVHDIPLIPSLAERCDMGTGGGIHGIDVDPSGTFLATSGHYENEVNIFDVNTLTPRIAFVRGHKDWIFDMRWLNERRLVSCSRDGNLAVWSLDKYLENQGAFDELGQTFRERYLYDDPIHQQYFGTPEEGLPLRAMAYSKPVNHLSIITTRKRIEILDTVADLRSVRSLEMHSCCNETVTAAANPLDPWEFAVGSQTHVNLYDIRIPDGLVKTFRSKHYNYGVRSVQFNNHMLSYSTGRGSVFFYDLRCGSEHLDRNSKALSVNLGKLPAVDDRQSPQSIPSFAFPCVAIYTHEYDYSRTRIFCAGGPLAACEKGSYASLWG